MEVEIILLVLIITVTSGYRSGYDCPKFCSIDGNFPVCSKEKNTYDNECFLKCDWADKACDGPCPCSIPLPTDCYCSKDKDYICTYDNETYDNECEAACDGKVKRCDGKCPCL